LALTLVAILTSGCKPAQLPDATSPGARLYISRCGNCHAPYNPHEMTASMWDTQVTMMEVKIQAAGQPALTPDERASIVDYLKQNAGTE
jgi:mono/diheme cytochrome c family protein